MGGRPAGRRAVDVSWGGGGGGLWPLLPASTPWRHRPSPPPFPHSAAAQRQTLLNQANSLASALRLQVEATGDNPLAGWVPPPPPTRRPLAARRAAAAATPSLDESASESTEYESDTDSEYEAAMRAAEAAAEAAAAARARAELPAGGRYALDPDVRDAIAGLYGVRDNVEKDVATALAFQLGTTEVALRHCFAKLRDCARTLTKRAGAAEVAAVTPDRAALDAAQADRVATLAVVAPLLDEGGGVASVDNATPFVDAVRRTTSHTVRASVLGAICATRDADVRAALRDAGAGDVARAWLTAAPAGGAGTEAALALRALAVLPGGGTASASAAAAAGRLSAAAVAGDAALREWGARGSTRPAGDDRDGSPAPTRRTRASTGALPLPRAALGEEEGGGAGRRARDQEAVGDAPPRPGESGAGVGACRGEGGGPGGARGRGGGGIGRGGGYGGRRWRRRQWRRRGRGG